MKKVLVVLFLATLVVSLEAQQSPPWLNEMPPDDVLWGIGVAKQSNQGMSKTMSENRARQSISFQLESDIEAGITDYNLDAGSGGNIVSTSLQEVISRTVSRSRLVGSKVISLWVAPDGTYWTRIQYSKEDAKRWVRELLKDKGEETYDDEKVASGACSLIDANKEVKVTR